MLRGCYDDAARKTAYVEFKLKEANQNLKCLPCHGVAGYHGYATLLKTTGSIVFRVMYIPEPAVVVEHLARAAVLARVAEARVDLVLTLVAMVTRCALAAVLLEADQVTGTAVLAGRGEADVALGQDLGVSAVCQRASSVRLSLILS